MESTKRGKEQTTTEEHNKDKNEGAAKGLSGNQGNTGQQSQSSQQQGNGATEMVDQAKQAVTDAYNRTSKTLNDSYSQAMDYGRDHPGQLTLIAFGAGIGIGLLLSSGLTSSRSRTGRIVPPVVNALSEIAIELFR
jgi:ElaB/YqjD/DUF883 family membrane-anchored ribosome-binding protein